MTDYDSAVITPPAVMLGTFTNRSGRCRWTTALGGLALLAPLLLAGCGGGGADGGTSPTPTPPAPTSPGVLSITTNPQLLPAPPNATAMAAALTAAQDLAYGAGARGAQINFSWGALEPTPGNFDSAKLAELTAAVDRAARLSLALYVGFQPINTIWRDVPSDLVGKPFDDAVVKQRFRALLDRVVGQNVGRIKYLAIGNEVDIYLSAHPDELAPYTSFFRDMAAYARSLDPALKVGVTGTADGALGANAGLLTTLNNAGADAVMLTYYPIRFDANGAVTVRDPMGTGAEVTRLLTFAGTKPVVFQEAGYPSAAVNGSSQAMQATFFRELYTAWRAAGGRIPYVNVFTLHDFTTQTCDELAAHYQFKDSASFKAYLCSLGLRQTDGTAKASWTALAAEPK